MNTYKIDELYASAWQHALEEVAGIVNANTGLELFEARDWNALENIALKLGVDFDANGEIVREANK